MATLAPPVAAPPAAGTIVFVADRVCRKRIAEPQENLRPRPLWDVDWEKAGAVAPVGGGATATVNCFVVQIKKRSAYRLYNYILKVIACPVPGIGTGVGR
jgi:hypothetical protein